MTAPTPPEPGLAVRLTTWADDLQRRHSVIGFPFAVVKKYGDDGGVREAALVTYYGFLSLFPLLLLVVWSVSKVLVGDPELSARLISEIVPPQFRPTVTDAVAALPQSGLPAVLGIIGLLFAGLGVVASAYHSLNHLVGIPHRERFDLVPRYLRWFAGLAVLLLGAVAVGGLSVVLALAGSVPWVGELLASEPASAVGGWLGSIGIAFVVLLVLARLLVCRPVAWRAVWPAALIGAVLITLVLVLGGQVLALLVTRSGVVYGTFASVVGIFSLLYLVSQGLMLSAEVAIVRRRRLWPRSLDGRRLTPADRRAYAGLAREQERIDAVRVRVGFSGGGARG